MQKTRHLELQCHWYLRNSPFHISRVVFFQLRQPPVEPPTHRDLERLVWPQQPLGNCPADRVAHCTGITGARLMCRCLLHRGADINVCHDCALRPPNCSLVLHANQPGLCLGYIITKQPKHVATVNQRSNSVPTADKFGRSKAGRKPETGG